jgi:hypothetical protein
MAKLMQVSREMLNQFIDNCIKDYLENSDSLTTLDLKNYFRRAFRNIEITQSDVSEYMNENYQTYNLEYTDNGTYRTYYLSDEPTYTSKSLGTIRISALQHNHLLRIIAKEFNNLKKDEIYDVLHEADGLLFNLLKEYISRNEN